MLQQVIALVGMPGSGKSSVVKMLVDKSNIPHIYFGSITLEEIERRGLSQNQENEKKIRTQLRETHGMAAYAKLSLPKIEKLLQNNATVLIDGLYSWSEYTLLRSSLKVPLILIAIISRRENRYRRLAVRKERPLTHEEAEKRDFAEIEGLEKGGPIALCDYYIGNDGDYEDLKKAVDALVEELI